MGMSSTEQVTHECTKSNIFHVTASGQLFDHYSLTTQRINRKMNRRHISTKNAEYSHVAATPVWCFAAFLSYFIVNIISLGGRHSFSDKWDKDKEVDIKKGGINQLSSLILYFSWNFSLYLIQDLCLSNFCTAVLLLPTEAVFLILFVEDQILCKLSKNCIKAWPAI